MSLTTRIALVVLLLSLQCCTVTRSALCLLRSTDHFKMLDTDRRVLYEEGAESYAEQMALLLPRAIGQVEAGHYRLFAEPVVIHVCATEESYAGLTGLKAPASATPKGVFFSPRLVREGRPLLLYLAHELSHLSLQQQIGTYAFARLPAWFKEGLAAFVSQGGGAHMVTEAEAAEAIVSGTRFTPHEKGGILFRRYADYWGLSNHMFYRQSMMFVAFLKETDETRYRDFLLRIQNGERLSHSFLQSYDVTLDTIWNDFLSEIAIR